MPPDSDLYRELQKLRGREGLDRADLFGHLGPEVRLRCRLTGREPAAQVRASVEAMLAALMDPLPPNLQQAAQLAFALRRVDYRLPKLDDRVGRLATLQQVSTRTARRLMDKALSAMADVGDDLVELPGDPAAGSSGWRVSSLRALFRLDTATPELYEIRTIVATREIDEVVVRIGLPEAPEGVGDPVVEALFGARVRSLERNGRGSHKLVLALPATLAAGEKQEFWIRVVLPPGQPTWSHYAIVPLDPCESGTVRVRFAPGRPPREVWLLDMVPYSDLRERPPGRELVEPTGLGDVRRDFFNLREGYGYGLAWTDDTGGESGIFRSLPR